MGFEGVKVKRRLWEWWAERKKKEREGRSGWLRRSEGFGWRWSVGGCRCCGRDVKQNERRVGKQVRCGERTEEESRERERERERELVLEKMMVEEEKETENSRR